MKRNRWSGPHKAVVLNQEVPNVVGATVKAWSYVTSNQRHVVVEIRAPRGLLSVVTVLVPR